MSKERATPPDPGPRARLYLIGEPGGKVFFEVAQTPEEAARMLWGAEARAAGFAVLRVREGTRERELRINPAAVAYVE